MLPLNNTPTPQVSDARLRAVTPESLRGVAAVAHGRPYVRIDMLDWLEAVYGAALMASERAPSFETTAAAMRRWLPMHPQARYCATLGHQDAPRHIDIELWRQAGVQFVVMESLS